MKAIMTLIRNSICNPISNSVIILLSVLFVCFSGLNAQSSAEGPNVNQTNGPPMRAFEYRLFRDGSGNTQYVCIAPSRGKTANAGTSITAATNATPIVITTSVAHGLNSDYEVTIAGVLVNTAANGTFIVTVVDATHFSLNGSVGNGVYTSGGTVSTQAPLMTDTVWAIRRLYYTGTNLDASTWIAGSTSMNQVCANRATLVAQ